MEEIFYLNLNPKENKYKFYNLYCNPFESPKSSACHAMLNGIPKYLIIKYINQFGLSDEVAKIILKNTKRNCKYKVIVNDTTMKILELT